MAALLVAVPTVLTLPADGRPDSALKPQILGQTGAAAYSDAKHLLDDADSPREEARLR